MNELLLLPGQSERVRKATDAIALLGHASQELSLRRHGALKPYVNKTIARLCDENSGVSVTDKLFGDNLAATIKDMKELDKLGASVSTDNERHPFGQKSKSAFLAGASKGGQYNHHKQSPNSGKGPNKRNFKFGFKGNRRNNNNPHHHSF